MKKHLTLLCLCSFFCVSQAHAKFSGSFIVEINDLSIRVISPKKKQKTVSVIIQNNTLDKIVSELKTGNKVFKTLCPQVKKVKKSSKLTTQK